jgi:hypothetical protein
MMCHLKYLFLIFSITFISACNLTDNDQPIPFFLDLSGPEVLFPGGLFNDTHKINEVWVFADGQILGVFPLPARVPVVSTNQDAEITILAGIRNNGMNDTPVFYPFYKAIKATVKAIPNGTQIIPLKFTYLETAKIPINESFEIDNVFTFDIDGKPETFITVNTEESTLGNNSGKVTLSNSLKFVEVASTTEILKGQNARGESYIEFDYKGEGEIAVGIAKYLNGVIKIEYFLFVPAKDDWNKIYVDVTDKLSPQDYDKYRLLIGYTRTGSSIQSKVYIDNYKHVHF